MLVLDRNILIIMLFDLQLVARVPFDVYGAIVVVCAVVIYHHTNGIKFANIVGSVPKVRAERRCDVSVCSDCTRAAGPWIRYRRTIRESVGILCW